MLTNMSRALICLLVLLNGVSVAHAVCPAEAAAEMLDSAAIGQQPAANAAHYQQFEAVSRDMRHQPLAVLGAAAPVLPADPAETHSSPPIRHDISRE
ncbi:MAG: hypothetical protein AAGH53_01555 [Pseudomonadota bacterium]